MGKIYLVDTNRRINNKPLSSDITLTPSDIGAAPATVFEGATSNDDGVQGLVPAPSAGEEGLFLRGDGAWANVSGGQRGASVISAVRNPEKNAPFFYTREEVIDMNRSTVEWHLANATTAQQGDILVVTIPQGSIKDDPYYVFGTVERIGDSAFGSEFRFVALRINGYILSGEKGDNGADGILGLTVSGKENNKDTSLYPVFLYSEIIGYQGVTKPSIDSYKNIQGNTATASFPENGGMNTIFVNASDPEIVISCVTSGSTDYEHAIFISQSVQPVGNVDSSNQMKFRLTGPAVILAKGKYCLTGDTMVTMADGTEKRLDEICVGDEVLSFDWDTMKLVPNKVIFTDKDEGKTHTCYDKWTFSDGTVVKTVHRHEFYNVEARGMKYMDEWKLGEHTYRKGGRHVALVAHETVEDTVRHYKITLEKGTNYFANGLLTGDRNNPKDIML